MRAYSIALSVLLCLPLLVNSREALRAFNNDGKVAIALNLDKIKDGFEKGKQLFDSIKASDFVQTVQNMSKWAGPLIESIVSVVKIFTGLNAGDSKELAYMKEQFKLINQRMDSFDNEFEKVKKAIDWNTVKVSFAEYERNINVMQDSLVDLLNAPPDAIDVMKQMFMTHYSRQFNGATEKLYIALVLPRMEFSQNLVLAVRKYTDDHLRKVQKFLLGNLQLLLKGLEIDLAYLTFQNLDAGQSIWQPRIEELQKIFTQVDEQIKNNWNAQMKADIETFSQDNWQLSNEQYTSEFYRFLNDKFPYRTWFLVVYNPISTSTRHNVFSCGGSVNFRLRDKNIVVGSRPANYNSFSQPEAQQVLNGIPNQLNYKMEYAEQIMKTVMDTAGGICSKYHMGAVIEWGGGVWFISPAGTNVYRKWEGSFVISSGRDRRIISRTYNVILFG